MLRILAFFLSPTILFALRESELDAGQMLSVHLQERSSSEAQLDAVQVLDSQLPKEVHDQLDEERSLKAKEMLILIGDYFGDSRSEQSKEAIDIFKGDDEKLDDDEVRMLLDALKLMDKDGKLGKDDKLSSGDRISAMGDEDVNRFMQVINYFGEPEPKASGAQTTAVEDSEEGATPGDTLEEVATSVTPPLDGDSSGEATSVTSGEPEQQHASMGEEENDSLPLDKLEDASKEGDSSEEGNDSLTSDVSSEGVENETGERDSAGEPEAEHETDSEGSEDLTDAGLSEEENDLPGAAKQQPPSLLSVHQQDILRASVTPAMSKGRFESMTQMVGFFSDGHGKLADTGAESLVTALDLFDTNDDKHLDNDELANAMVIIPYFAGKDKKLDAEEFGKMRAAIETYPSISALKDVLVMFDTGGMLGGANQYLSDSNLNDFTVVSKFFTPQVESSEKRTTNVEAMQRVIHAFIGQSERLDSKSLANLKSTLQQFDFDGNGELDSSELNNFNTAFQYLAEDYAKLKKAVGLFAANQKTLDGGAAEQLLEALGIFDFDGNEKLDQEEIDAFFKVSGHFVDATKKHTDVDKMKVAIAAFFGEGAKVEPSLAEKFKSVSISFQDDEGFTQMQEAVGIFDGEDNKIDAEEADRLIDAISRTNPAGKGRPMPSEDLEHFMTVIRSFAGDDQEIDETEFAAFQAVMGNMTPRSTAITRDRMQHLVQVLQNFDVGEKGYLNANEICGLAVVVKSCLKNQNLFGSFGGPKTSILAYSPTLMGQRVPNKLTSENDMDAAVQEARKNMVSKLEDPEICSVTGKKQESASVEEQEGDPEALDESESEE